MPDKRRQSKNWRMSKKNKKLQAMRVKVPAASTEKAAKVKPHRARAVVIASHLLSTAAGLSSYISQSSSQRGVAGAPSTHRATLQCSPFCSRAYFLDCSCVLLRCWGCRAPLLPSLPFRGH
jgi:hypothetical protein